ncbi:hypothetical protein [Streptomyces sudanensis]|uniref:hypothetical protein n=1 Tax=Streptomyces sudanensis TaxID=436397 RepID=UPI0020CCDCA9|nr:hypothetical protein [Streptomyces sudanensis]MCP9958514.1 hypothetical protein [Streptomyces sudanensis]
MTQSGHGQEGQSWGQAPGQPWGPPPPRAVPEEDSATQYLRPVPPAPRTAPEEDSATQYLRPVPPAPAPLPPERGQAPAENPSESTQFLGTGFGARQGYPQQPPRHPQGTPPHRQPQADPDAEATQYIAPVPGHTGPPAEFDNLFRDGTAGATQRMPRVEPPAPHPGHGHPPQQPHGHRPPPPYADPRDHDDHDGSGRRRSSKLVLAAAVVVGCAVVGLGAGALMSGGDEAPEPAGDKTGAVSAPPSAPAPAASSAPAPDPVKKQAEELDKLLADSNDSREAVIRSVENIKKCQALDKAAADLKEAAGQRRELVNRLRDVEIDRLPDHAELSASLTRAWEASATADDHYAAWARQVKSPKNCKDGRARNTASTAKAAVASGDATAAKRQAARLWNGIAETYGLTKRQPTQL